MIGPHNTKLHRIGNINEVYRQKYSYINGLIQNQLKRKGEILTANLDFIDKKINELEDMAGNIQKEIKYIII